MSSVETREAAYWDREANRLSWEALRAECVSMDLLARKALELLGDLRGRRVLDVGCGTGEWSVLLAERGADVWAIDISPRSVEATQQRATLRCVEDRVHASVMSATALTFPDHFFAAASGRDIIHHVPDSAAFGRQIARVLRADGRAVFQENCANNPLLMLARDRLCGRFGIPKWSSDDEYPLTRERLTQFAAAFAEAEVCFPQFLCFFYLDAKLFGYRNKLVSRVCRILDSAVYRHFPAIRPYSYRQVICCRKEQ